ncbi:hypothetical protein YK48G_11500 [Lentilactobacillus fungorum]|uniref:Peptidase metallopeptidase domain-containing protein n=1 Tax=Lentilactobacillus fungorum TaxID=2201250 RepID=A0ABQ3VYU3_9LACO|nr:matrixin family metalloprotease [Lentilactobacillus fungorum]GHP13725.1 hypothetical protein YK48G_11500 [Lentilactobacillus fungorum]
MSRYLARFRGLSALLIMPMVISLVITTPTAAQPAAQVLTKKKITPKAYHATAGYIYSTPKLTKPSHNAKHYPKTIFYAYQQVLVKKATGKNAVYYYVSSQNKQLRGYIWRGYLKPIAKQQSAMSQKSLIKLINAAADMDPDKSLLGLKQINYQAHENVFDLGYNLLHFSPQSTFKDHQATIYVTANQLTPYTEAAMTKWNQALGTTVFKLGSKRSHTLTVQFGNGTKEGWDGLYNGKAVYVDQTHFDDPKYPIGYMNPKLAEQTSTDQYWTGVIAHELGHTLGLDHTGYQEDLMYAPNSDGNVIAKYLWKKPIQKSASGLDGTEMATITTRDLDRAKLAKQLGYW